MRVLFIGVGLSHYYNQVLNRLARESDIEVFNLVDSKGKSNAGAGVYETAKGIVFQIVKREQISYRTLSHYKYLGYKNIKGLLLDIRPDIIVTAESFVGMFMYHNDVLDVVRQLHIKIILKDIPFRMKKYEMAKYDIQTGVEDENIAPLFLIFFTKLFTKLHSKFLCVLFQKVFYNRLLKSLYLNIFGRRVLLKKIEIKKQILNFCDAHVDYVEEAYDIFGSYGVKKDRIFIIYNSPDTDILFSVRDKIETQDPILPPSDYRLLHVGRLVKWKRVDLLIQSLQLVRSKYEKTELCIIGTGPEEQSLRKLAKNLGVQDSVHFLGGIYDPEVLGKYLQSATLYVLAGMGGISINDAMIFGKPVICSVCDGTEKKLVVEGYNGLFFEEGNLLSLTNAIQELFGNKLLIAKMGENSTQIIKEKININTVIDGYRKAFEFVLNK